MKQFFILMNKVKKILIKNLIFLLFVRFMIEKSFLK